MTDGGVHIGYPWLSSMEHQNKRIDEYRAWGIGKGKSSNPLENFIREN